MLHFSSSKLERQKTIIGELSLEAGEDDGEQGIGRRVLLDDQESLHQFNALGSVRWDFELADGTTRELDQNERILLNYSRMQLLSAQFEYVALRFKQGIMATNEEDQKHQESFHRILNYYRTFIKHRYVYLSSTEKVDVWLKLLYVRDENGNVTAHQYDDALNNNTKGSQQQADADPFANAMKYRFENWGWLANQYLKQNDFIMPSWSKVQECIIQEEVIQIREEEAKKMKSAKEPKSLMES